MAEFDVVVVGGGHNGVIAASILARHGLRVVVVERNPWLGGLAGGVPGGLPLSLFAYVVGLVPGELASWLGFLPEMHEADPSWVELAPDGEVLLRWWRDPGRLAREAGEAGLDGLPRLLGLAARFWRCYKSLGLYYTPEPPSPGEAAALLDSCDPEAAVFVEKRVTAILSDYLPAEWWDTIIYPSMFKANGFALAYYLQNMGVWDQPVGGMRALARGLQGLLESSGASLMAGASVEGLVFEGGRVAGVRLGDGRVLRASRAVVYSAPVYTLARLEGAERLPEADLKRLEAMGRRASRVTRVDYVLRRPPSPPREEGWRGHPIIVYWTRSGGGDYTYPTLYTPQPAPGFPHIVQASGFIEDPLDPPPPGVDPDRDVVLYWARGRRAQEECCGNSTGHPDHVPMVDPYMMDSRPLPGWGPYKTSLPGLYHASASSYPGGEVNGVAGVNAALRVLLDSGQEPRVPLPWRRPGSTRQPRR